MRQKSLEKFSKLFYAALYPGNGKLLTHKRTDLVDSEARASLVLIRGEMWMMDAKDTSRQKEVDRKPDTAKLLQPACCFLPPFPLHLQYSLQCCSPCFSRALHIHIFKSESNLLNLKDPKSAIQSTITTLAPPAIFRRLNSPF